MDTSRPRKSLVNWVREGVANGFVIGGVLGSAYHYAKGGYAAVCKNAPRTSCSFAVLLGAYAAIEHAMVSARGKEEPVLDCAVAWGGASGIIGLPKGLRHAGQSALIGAAVGGVVLGGLRILGEDQGLSPQEAQQAMDDPGLPAPALRPTFPDTDR